MALGHVQRLIRDVRHSDAAAVAAIYGHHVLTGLGTFEAEPPSAGEIGRRIAAVQTLGLPYLLAESEGAVAGFAYASAFRPRIGYRFTAEDSVYVAPGAEGRGLGRALLTTVIQRCAALGVRQLLAVVGDSANAGSIGLHSALGFETIGVARGVGFKHGRWVDIVWMQKTLGDGDRAPPQGEGLPLGGG